MNTWKLEGLLIAGVMLLASTVAAGAPSINELADRTVRVTTGDCVVRFSQQGRVLDYSESCERAQIGEANAALRQHRAGQPDAPGRPSTPRPQPPRSGGLDIVAAEYGSEAGSCDATRAFERECDGQAACQVEVGNGLCGDPARGEGKFVEIRYRCNGREQRLRVDEGEAATLQCGAGTMPPGAVPGVGRTIRIEDARYGAGDRTCEADRAFARACNDRATCEVAVDNQLCGDPAPGERKAVQVEYRCGDRSVDATVEEGDVARLACAGRTPPSGRPSRDTTEIRIEDVRYGSGNRSCDASTAFARRCNDETRCEVAIDNGLCGDPAPGARKSAEIEWRCGDRPLRLDADEGQRVRLDCSGGRTLSGSGTDMPSIELRMDEVTYGFGDRNCDATRIFARECNDQPECSVQVGNDLCGDPAPNTKKRADIEYRCGDRRRAVSVDEGDIARLACR